MALTTRGCSHQYDPEVSRHATDFVAVTPEEELRQLGRRHGISAKALTRVLNLKATLPSAANLGPQCVEALHDLLATWPSVVKASFERTRDPLHYKPFTAPEEARLQQIYPGAHCLVGCVGGRGWGGGGGGGDACAAFGSVVSAFTVRWRARAACARGDVAALHRSTNMQAA